MSVTDQLVVGIDFGTTFTGVAAAYSGTPDQLEVIKTWPGSSGRTSDKVPTEFTYDLQTGHRSPPSSAVAKVKRSPFSKPSNRTEPFLKDVRWGYQLKPDEDRITCIKLFLDQHQELPRFANKLGNVTQLKQQDRDYISATADYLAKVREHVFLEFERRYGKDFMAITPVKYIFTVPAVWSDVAKDATLQAATRAGMGRNIRMISEPEAGALYAITVIQPNHLRVSDIITVCDVGGGTTDIISYRIQKLNPLCVEEAEVGTGALCGSAFLNHRFETFLQNRLSPKLGNIKASKPRTWQIALKEFETHVKRQFDGNPETEYCIPFPGVPDNERLGIVDGFLTGTGADVREIFEPVVAKVLKLVDGQLDSLSQRGLDVSAVVLIGGFGQSSYLFQRLKERLAKRRTRRGITVMQPVDAWTAVVRGAVLRGLEGSMVTSRKCRYHYGTPYAAEWNDTLYAGYPKYWSEEESIWRAANVMNWYVAKGEKITEQRRITLSLQHVIGYNDYKRRRGFKLDQELYACKDNAAPGQFNQSFERVCRVGCDLSTVPFALFERRINNRGGNYYRIKVDVIMTIDSASLGFSCEVQGKEYGKVTASFDHGVGAPSAQPASGLDLSQMSAHLDSVDLDSDDLYTSYYNVGRLLLV